MPPIPDKGRPISPIQPSYFFLSWQQSAILAQPRGTNEARAPQSASASEAALESDRGKERTKMPGVPHGRACDACRNQKKKCDYATPSCSRCQRLGLECAGSGERRFLFIDQRCRRRRPGEQQRDNSTTSLAISRPASSSASFLTGTTTRVAPPLPQTDSQILIGAFVSTIAPTTISFNLVQTYGPFLEMVPPRLGTHAALDNSARALVCAHRNVCLGRPATEESLARYSLAIRTLRLCLDKLDNTACSAETVCAIIMVMVCQELNGTSLRHSASHADGAARLLCARLGSGRPLDEFATAVRSHVRGMTPAKEVLLLAAQWFQGVWRRELRSDPARFESLVSGLYDGDDVEDEDTILIRRVQIPQLLVRAREARRSRLTSPESSAVFMELYALYERFRGDLRDLRTPSMAAVAITRYLGVPTSISPHGLRLLVACVCSCLLRGLLRRRGDRQPQQPQQQQPRSPFEDALAREAEELADAAFALAREAAKGRNARAAHVLVNCLMAWVCTGDAEKRGQVQGMYEEFMRHFSRAWVDGKVFAMWEALASDLFLVSDP